MKGGRRTAKGRIINIDDLIASAPHTTAVGNMKVNAQGDEIGKGGEVTATREQRTRAYYKNHPQLERFRNVYNPAKGLNPLYYLGLYLLDIIKEADGRGYSFDIEKIKHIPTKPREYQLTVTTGQLDYEFKLLQNKLLFGRENLSALPKYIENHRLFLEHNKNWMDNIGEIIIPHPLFKVIEGDIEKWERIKR